MNPSEVLKSKISLIISEICLVGIHLAYMVMIMSIYEMSCGDILPPESKQSTTGERYIFPARIVNSVISVNYLLLHFSAENPRPILLGTDIVISYV